MMNTKHIIAVAAVTVLGGAGIYITVHKPLVVINNQAQNQEAIEIPLLVGGDKENEVAPFKPFHTTLGSGNDIARMEKYDCRQTSYFFTQEFHPPPDTKESVGFFGMIFRNKRSPGNIIFEERFVPSDSGSAMFFPLSAPTENCDRIFLTRSRGTGLFGGIYELIVASNTVNKVVDSQDFNPSITPADFKQVISPDGEKILVASAPVSGSRCDMRAVTFIDLRKKTKKILARLTQDQSLAQFPATGGLSGNVCRGLNFGWQNGSEIYYDVYDSSSETTPFPLLGRKMASIAGGGERWFSRVSSEGDKIANEKNRIKNERRGLVAVTHLEKESSDSWATFSFRLSSQNGLGRADVSFENNRGRAAYKAIQNVALSNDEDIKSSIPVVYGVSTIYGDLYARIHVRFADGRDLILTGDSSSSDWDDNLHVPAYYVPDMKISSFKLIAKPEANFDFSNLDTVPASVSWEQAANLILGCQVKSTMKGHSEDGLRLINGRWIKINGAPSWQEIGDVGRNASSICGFRVGAAME